jgi:uncharacterized protein (TIGR00369 family)
MMNQAEIAARDLRASTPPPTGAPEQELIDWANGLPIAAVLNTSCLSAHPTECTFSVAEAPLPPNPNGAINGGVVAAIADFCLGVVSMMNAPRDQLSVTAALQGQYHRPAIPGLLVRSRLVSAGRRLIFVQCEIDDFQARRCASFQATMIVGGTERRVRGELDALPAHSPNN